MKIDTYSLFTVQAYFERGEDGNLLDFAVVRVIADNARSAIRKAKKLINKKNYRISEITEFVLGK